MRSDGAGAGAGARGLAHKDAEFPGRRRLSWGHNRAQGAAARQEAPAALWPPGPSAGGWEKLVTGSPNQASVGARKPGNGEDRNLVPGRLGGGERSATEAKECWEAESALLVRGVARFKRPEGTGVERGKTCGRNFLPRERKAGEKEAGKDLKCLSNFKNTPNTPSEDEVSRG